MFSTTFLLNEQLAIYKILFYLNYKEIYYIEGSRGAAARGVTVKPTGCGFDPHSRR